MGCGHTTKLTLSQRTWTCPHCAAVHDRDVNAASAILVFACLAFLEAQAQATTDSLTAGRADGKGGLHPEIDSFLARGGLAAVVRYRTASWSRETRIGQRIAACLEQAGTR